METLVDIIMALIFEQGIEAFLSGQGGISFITI